MQLCQDKKFGCFVFQRADGNFVLHVINNRLKMSEQKDGPDMSLLIKHLTPVVEGKITKIKPKEIIEKFPEEDEGLEDML